MEPAHEYAHLLTNTRYVVTNIAGNDELPYPGSPFKVGEVLELKPPTEAQRSISEESFIKKGVNVYDESYFNSFPGIFCKLLWFSLRRKEDLPGYVKFLLTNDIVPVTLYHYVEGRVYINKKNDFWYLVHAVPATEQEYLAFTSSQTVG